MIVYQPKGDFKSSIAVQEHYVSLLKNYHAKLVEQVNIETDFQKAKLSIELHELSTKLDAQIKTLSNKKDHFNNTFLPNYDKELSECEKEYDATWIEARNFIKLNEGSDLVPKFKNIMDSFMELDSENRKNIEVKNFVYKDLKTLLSLGLPNSDLSNKILDE